MPINEQIPLSAGAAGAAHIDTSIPHNIDSRIPMSAQAFTPIDPMAAQMSAYKLAMTADQFQEQQSQNLEAQRLREAKERDKAILQQYQQSGGDLYTSTGLTLAAKELSGKLSQESYDGLTKHMDTKRTTELNQQAALSKLSNDDLDLVSRQQDESAKVMSRAISAYDATLESTQDQTKATEAFQSAKMALVQSLKDVKSPTTGQAMYPAADLEKFASMTYDQLSNVVEDSKWMRDKVKEESANRLRDSQADLADANVEKRAADIARDKEKNRILEAKIAAKKGQPLDDEDVKSMAELMRVNGPTALSRFGLTPEQRQQVVHGYTTLNSEDGISAREGATAVLGIKADQKSVEKMVPQLDAITAFGNTMKTIGGKLVEIAKKVDSTGVPAIERWVRAGKKAIEGDADVTEFNSRMQTFRTEAARILTNPNLTGVLSDNARHEIESLIPNAASAEQVERGVNVLISEGDIRTRNLQEQIDTAKERINRGGRKAQTPAATPATDPAFKVDKATQDSRDKDAVVELKQELDDKVASLSSATTVQDKTRIQMDILALKREIQRKGGAKELAPTKPTVSNW